MMTGIVNPHFEVGGLQIRRNGVGKKMNLIVSAVPLQAAAPWCRR